MLSRWFVTSSNTPIALRSGAEGGGWCGGRAGGEPGRVTGLGCGVWPVRVGGVTSEMLPPEEWYARLPTVYAAACALITDEAGRVLLVKPNYRPYWNIPGGYIDANEAPHVACARELHEELGLAVELGALLLVDWVPAQEPRPRPITGWLFDGGTFSPERVAEIRIQEDELDDYAFVTPDRAV